MAVKQCRIAVDEYSCDVAGRPWYVEPDAKAFGRFGRPQVMKIAAAFSKAIRPAACARGEREPTPLVHPCQGDCGRAEAGRWARLPKIAGQGRRGPAVQDIAAWLAGDMVTAFGSTCSRQTWREWSALARANWQGWMRMTVGRTVCPYRKVLAVFCSAGRGGRCGLSPASVARDHSRFCVAL